MSAVAFFHATVNVKIGLVTQFKQEHYLRNYFEEGKLSLI